MSEEIKHQKCPRCKMWRKDPCDFRNRYIG